jgi:phage shock protein E
VPCRRKGFVKILSGALGGAGGSAGFKTCRIADFQIGEPFDRVRLGSLKIAFQRSAAMEKPMARGQLCPRVQRCREPRADKAVRAPSAKASRRGVANRRWQGKLGVVSNTDLIRVAVCVGCIAALALALRSARAQEKSANASGVITHANAKEAARLIAEKKAVVLDIRTPKEFAAGHIAGATNVDFSGDDFAKQLEKLDKEKAYVVHCASGGRSTRSLPQLEKLGFKHVIHLDGGIKAWQAAGNPLTKR